jgi:hypothetical protein
LGLQKQKIVRRLPGLSDFPTLRSEFAGASEIEIGLSASRTGRRKIGTEFAPGFGDRKFGGV